MMKWICLKDERPKEKGTYITAVPSINGKHEWAYSISRWNGSYFESPGGYAFLYDAKETHWQAIEPPPAKVGNYAFEDYLKEQCL